MVEEKQADKSVESEKIVEKKETEWVKVKPAELEKLVIDLHKQGNSPAKIGLILRDQHGVPKAKQISKKITKILNEAKIQINSQEALSKEVESLTKHVEKNKHDVPAKRTLTKRIWSLERIKKAAQ